VSKCAVPPIVLLAAVPAAARASSPHWIPGARARVLADGGHYALYKKGPGTVTVIDTQTGTSLDRPVDSDCQPVMASAGRAVLDCGETSGYRFTAYAIALK
jgi:hypothetical protein